MIAVICALPAFPFTCCILLVVILLMIEAPLWLIPWSCYFLFSALCCICVNIPFSFLCIAGPIIPCILYLIWNIFTFFVLGIICWIILGLVFTIFGIVLTILSGIIFEVLGLAISIICPPFTLGSMLICIGTIAICVMVIFCTVLFLIDLYIICYCFISFYN